MMRIGLAWTPATSSTMTEYVKTKDVHKLVRQALKPGLAAEKFRRAPGGPMAWSRPHNESQTLGFGFETEFYSGSATGGSLHGYMNLCPTPPQPFDSTINRHRMFTTCLLQEEISELEWIQSSINLRRPVTEAAEELLEMMKGASGAHLRSLFQAIEDPYVAGMSVTISYYSREDVSEILAFVMRVLPTALSRFIEDRCPLEVTRRSFEFGDDAPPSVA